MKQRLLLLIFAAISLSPAQAKEIKPDRMLLYKSVEDVELKLHVFDPEGLEATDKRPAVVFFFGGGWASGSPSQFYQQARDLAALGMVTFSAEYRVKNRNKSTPFESVKDGKSAIRWVREHTAELGVDPERIVAAGGSAGGHIAICTGVIEGMDEEGENLEISSVPDLMIAFNPVLDTTAEGYGSKLFTPEQQTLISPAHHVRAGLAPTMLFHGTKDKTVPFENAVRFTKLMTEAGNECELLPFEGRGHGFFNGSGYRAKNDDVDYDAIMAQNLKFLAGHGYLKDGKAVY
ncbi:alpha/beta hydrolase [Luteolibacter sp. AS25]|uniref:alpha/beta hydrolase n=1 Tax=Luteolibacter sp. AS25 TaxID=3135776 RepID=UPI00398AEE99